MSDVAADQEALVTYELIRWLSASCPEHERFDAACAACQQVPQSCPEHPKVNGTFPGFDLGCQACQATRPGYETVRVVGQQVMGAEQAAIAFGIPFRRVGKGMIRLPLNLLRRAR